MVVVFAGAGYIAMDTALGWTDTFVTSAEEGYRNYALYVIYLLFPIISLAAYFILEAVLVLKVLGEKRPMSKHRPICPHILLLNWYDSTSLWCRIPLRYRPGFRVYY